MFIAKMKSRKTQMETMGLAMIVILVSLVILFVVGIILTRQPSEIKNIFYNKKLADSTVYTLLVTTTDCRELPIGQLLIDCAKGPYVLDCPGNINSCDYAGKTINDILDSTLAEWNKTYYLAANISNRNLLKLGNECKGEKASSAPCCILPVSGNEQLTINLDICS